MNLLAYLFLYYLLLFMLHHPFNLFLFFYLLHAPCFLIAFPFTPKCQFSICMVSKYAYIHSFIHSLTHSFIKCYQANKTESENEDFNDVIFPHQQLLASCTGAVLTSLTSMFLMTIEVYSCGLYQFQNS